MIQEIGKPFMRSLDWRHFCWGIFIFLIVGIVRGCIHRRYAEPTKSWQPFNFIRFAGCCALIAVAIWFVASWLPWYAVDRYRQRCIDLGVVTSRTATMDGERIEIKYPTPVTDGGRQTYGKTVTRTKFEISGDEWLPFALLCFTETLLAPSIVMRIPRRRRAEVRGFEVLLDESKTESLR